MSTRWVIQEIEETRDITNLTGEINDLKRPDNPEWSGFRVDPSGEDAPKKLFWKGRQWAVTDYGVETYRNAPYHYYLTYEQIAKDPVILSHVAEKTWADAVDFMEAAFLALQRVAKGEEKL